MSIESRPTVSGDHEKTPLTDPRFQIALALLEFQSRHPEVPISLSDPFANSKEVRDLAMLEWVAGDEQSASAQFRAWVETHKEERVDITDTAALKRLRDTMFGTMH